MHTARSFVLVLAAGACAGDSESVSTAISELDITQFVLPRLPADERAAIVHKYDALDPTDLVPRGLLEDAIVYYDMNLALIPKPRSIAIVDFSRFSGEDRYWLVDTTDGVVEAHKVAHGDGSDPDNDGNATVFGNTDSSHMTSLGFYLTGGIYNGTHPYSMRLDGLSPDGSINGMANTNVRSRGIVMHGASYVDDTSDARQGRSNGCLAMAPAVEVDMVDRIHDGSLIYAALSPLDPPVGRTPAAPPSGDDPPPSDDEASVDGGCSTGGGAGCASALLVALATLAGGPTAAGRRRGRGRASRG
jgi:hypothetical protein